MGHTIGDGIIVLALAAAFLGYYYMRHRTAQSRLEIIHKERLIAMEKGIPLPELPIDPPVVQKPPDPQVLPILGTLLLALGVGTMIALSLVQDPDLGRYWPMPLPLAVTGMGILLYFFLSDEQRR